MAHIGVIKALEDAGIKIDYIAGTSMGAIVGGYYAATRDVEFLEREFQQITKKDIFHPKQLIKKQDGLFKSKRIPKVLEDKVKNINFSDCLIPFAAVATDVKNGEEVVLSKGNLADAIKASVALPVIFNPAQVDDRLLMDGGFSNPVPADVVRKMGADYIIAVDVSSEWIDLSVTKPKITDLVSTLYNALSVIEYQLAQRILREAKTDLILRPPVLGFGWLEFNRSKEIIQAGESELRKNLKKIRSETGYPEPSKTPLEKVIDFIFENWKKL